MSMRAGLSRVAVRVRDVFPLTLSGALIACAAALALSFYGLRRMDLILLAMGVAATAFVTIVVITTALTALVIRLRYQNRTGGEALRVECGRATETDFSLPRVRLLPFLQVTWSWEKPLAPVQSTPRGKRLWERVTPTHRATLEHVVRRVQVGDTFGLSRITFRLREQRSVRLTPSVGSLRQMHVVRSIAGGNDISHPLGPAEGDRFDMRRYVAGDPTRFVLWKVFAKSRQLVVRTPERAISPRQETYAYLVTGVGDEAASGAARVAVESGALGSDWVLGADGVDIRATSAIQAVDVLAQSASASETQQGAGLASFLQHAGPGGPVRSVVFVPPHPGPWLDRVAAAVRASRANPGGAAPVDFVVGIDGIDRAEPKAGLNKYLWKKEGPRAAAEVGPAPTEDVQAVVKALTALRAQVLIADRPTGRVYYESQLKGLGGAS